MAFVSSCASENQAPPCEILSSLFQLRWPMLIPCSSDPTIHDDQRAPFPEYSQTPSGLGLPGFTRQETASQSHSYQLTPLFNLGKSRVCSHHFLRPFLLFTSQSLTLLSSHFSLLFFITLTLSTTHHSIPSYQPSL